MRTKMYSLHLSPRLWNQLTQLQPRQKPSEKDLPNMREALEYLSKVIAKQFPNKTVEELRQPDVDIELLDEAGRKQAINRYKEKAKESLESLQQTLQEFDPRSKVNVKSKIRAWEKAENEYEGDPARILDYLRGQVCLTVYKVDNGDKLYKRLSDILERLKNKGYELVRLKESLLGNLPRILLNFRKCGFVLEVQVHFRLKGYDDEYQNTKHLLYELSRKQLYLDDYKMRVLNLLEDMMSKVGLTLSENDLIIKAKFYEHINLRESKDRYELVIKHKHGTQSKVFTVRETVDKEGESFFALDYAPSEEVSMRAVGGEHKDENILASLTIDPKVEDDLKKISRNKEATQKAPVEEKVAHNTVEKLSSTVKKKRVEEKVVAKQASVGKLERQNSTVVPDGIDAFDWENPHNMDLLISNDVLQAEFDHVSNSIATLRAKRQYVPQSLQDRYQKCQLKMMLLASDVEEGKLTLPVYLEQVKKSLAYHTKLVNALMADNRKDDAKKVLTRVKTMQDEVVTAAASVE